MLTVITGASGSGKSVFAENYICELHRQKPETKLLYVATMQPYGQETLQKIERHREQRKDKGFYSVDQYCQIENTKFVDENTLILLECLSNLLANEMYAKEQGEQEVCKRILDGLKILEEKSDSLVVVTNEIFSEGIGDWEGSKAYLKALGILNQQLTKQAEQVYQVVAGIPVLRKEKKHKEMDIKIGNHMNRKELEKRSLFSGKILVIGGAYQGKTKWAIQKFNLEQPKIIDCQIENVFEIEKKNAEILIHIEKLIWKILKEYQEFDHKKQLEVCWKIVKNLWIKKENCIFIVDEIGSGIIPLEKEQRIYRELVGRITCRLAKQADQVYQITAGLPMCLKYKLGR